jgi:hypothetical protein
VIGTNLFRGEYHPLRIVPDGGKVFEDSDEAASSQEGAVFDEDVTRFNFPNDSGIFSPQAASAAGEPGAVASRANVLAWKPARYDVNSSAPRSSVEGTYIVPNGERWKVPVILSLHESSRAKGADFHSSDCPPAQQNTAENSASSACEKCQLIQWSFEHG